MSAFSDFYDLYQYKHVRVCIMFSICGCESKKARTKHLHVNLVQIDQRLEPPKMPSLDLQKGHSPFQTI